MSPTPEPPELHATMTEDLELETATNFAFALAWVAGAIAIGYLLGLGISWALLRISRPGGALRDIALLTRRPLRVILMVVGATIAVNRTTPADANWRGWADHVLLILLIGGVTWLAASLVKVAERRAIARFGGGDAQMTDADLHRRRIRTQVTVLRRLAIAIVILLGAAAALMTFPAFADIGTGLFASAGVLSVVAGLAAQTSLGAVFAGLQIAFSDAIRVGDIVVVEEQWGRIEEITLTYVVVHIWDERRFVLPSTYFTTTPFENWTRKATELLGTVELDADFTVPLSAMRAELDRLLSESDVWDGKTGVLQVTDAVGGRVRVRILVSAQNSGAIWDLRCRIREGMVEWLQRTAPGALPRWRVEESQIRAQEAGRLPADAPRRDGEGVGDSLFTGSKEAEERAKAFEGPGDVALEERAEDAEVPRGYDGNGDGGDSGS